MAARAVDPLRPPPADLAGFPAYRLRTPRYRIHRRGVGPWWFNSDGTRRFDLPAPRGTCYLADTEEGAFLEVFGSFVGGIVPEEEVCARAVSWLGAPGSPRLANLLDGRVLRFGVSAELATTPDYELSQAWARALAAAGFDGIRYHLRHDPSSRQVGVALFGDAGERDWPVLRTRSVSDRTTELVRRRFGILVLPAP